MSHDQSGSLAPKLRASTRQPVKTEKREIIQFNHESRFSALWTRRWCFSYLLSITSASATGLVLAASWPEPVHNSHRRWMPAPR